MVERSHAAYGAWRTTGKDERSAILNRVADLYEERIDELALIIAREMGKPLREGKGEVKLVASIYRYYAEQGPELLADTPLDPQAGGRALVRKEPIGPLLGIMPWNFPYYQVARFAAPNLMIGNTIILKHAPQCPESALADRADLPRRGAAERRLPQHLRHQRAGGRHHRRRPRGRGLGHRQRARRVGGRGGRRTHT